MCFWTRKTRKHWYCECQNRTTVLVYEKKVTSYVRTTQCCTHVTTYVAHVNMFAFEKAVCVYRYVQLKTVYTGIVTVIPTLPVRLVVQRTAGDSISRYLIITIHGCRGSRVYIPDAYFIIITVTLVDPGELCRRRSMCAAAAYTTRRHDRFLYALFRCISV